MGNQNTGMLESVRNLLVASKPGDTLTKHSARELALKVLHDVDVNGAYANIALRVIMERYRPRGPDRGLLTELSYGTLRRLNTINWILERFMAKPLSRQSPWVRNILRIGAYQLFFLDRIPASAACNEAVNLGKKYASERVAGFINGVLRRVVREKHGVVFPDLTADPVGHISLKYSHPAWLVKLWLEELGLEETVRTCAAGNKTPAATIRANVLKTNREELMGLLGNELDLLPARYAREGIIARNLQDVESLSFFRDGYFFVQGESSMLVAQAVGAPPGVFILDLCGAPGGKATHLAELMGDAGRIVVVDIHPHRLALVHANCSRLGIKSIETVACDARKLEGMFWEAADYVLVDAPCSGLGVLSHKPDTKWRKEAQTITRVAELQREILMSAARCVRSGGTLIYSTCTISREENLEQIKSFLAADDRFALEDLRPFLPQQLDLKGTLPGGYVQLMPYQGLDGFFIARMRRHNN